MKKKFSLQLEVTVDAEDESEFEAIRTNLNLLPEMADNFNLFTDGSMAKLVNFNSKLREVKPRKRKPKAKA